MVLDMWLLDKKSESMVWAHIRPVAIDTLKNQTESAPATFPAGGSFLEIKAKKQKVEKEKQGQY